MYNLSVKKYEKSHNFDDEVTTRTAFNKMYRIWLVLLLILSLVGCGGGGTESSSGPITQTPNVTPNAVAPTDFSAEENTQVLLDGNASNDPDGTISSYSWSQTSGPSVSLVNASQAVASFTAPEVDNDTPLSFQLTVTDNDGAVNSDSVTVTVFDPSSNQSPTAVAGDDFSTNENLSIELNGTASFDSDGSVVSYSWSQIAGSPSVAINNANSAIASFIAPDVDTATTLTFQLQVTDDEGADDSDTVSVTINPVSNPDGGDTDIPRAASRTSGVAPLSVLFTAGFSNSTETSRDFHDLEYSWDFGDSSSGTWGTTGKSKNTATGPVSSHVFESGGTYSVNLTIRDDSGVIDTDTFTITVSEPDVYFSGSDTTCISDTSNNDFAGCPAGATQVTTDDLSEMANYEGSDRRILLHRGSAWSRSGYIPLSDNTSTFHLGAYGNCQSPNAQGICANAPRINVSGSQELVYVNQTMDWRITDITFTGDSNTASLISAAFDYQRLLVLRVRTTGFRDAISLSHWREDSQDRIAENSIVSSIINEPTGYGTYIGSEKLTYMGNIVSNSRTSHILRVWQSYQGVIAHNHLSGASYSTGGGLHALKFHGPTESQIGSYAATGNSGLSTRTKFTVVSNNVFGSSGPLMVTVGPQNGTSNENLSDLLIEKNRFYGSFGTQGAAPDVQAGLTISGRYVTARNNVLDGTGAAGGYRGIVIGRQGIESTPLGNRVYNNTIYKGNASAWEDAGISVGTSARDTIVRNNLVSYPASGNQELLTDYSGNAVSDSNLLVNNAGFVDANNSNALSRDFSLQSSSPAINLGTVVPVFDDIRDVMRTGTYSLGAYHYQ